MSQWFRVLITFAYHANVGTVRDRYPGMANTNESTGNGAAHEGAQGRPRSATCGCCTAGCTCSNHCDIPLCRPVAACAYHSALSYAPLDRTYRYDSLLGDFVRVPVVTTVRS